MRYLLRALPTILLLTMVFTMAKLAPAYSLPDSDHTAELRHLHKSLQTLRAQLDTLDGKVSPATPRGIGR